MAKNKKPISPITADWSREACGQFEWAPERKLILTIRAYQIAQKSAIRKFNPVYKIYLAVILIRHRFWSAVSGADIALNSQLGGGLIVKHGQGVVIHPGAIIGVNCLIMSQVVIGAGKGHGLPNIGGHVDIGAGAKILGCITIGNNVKIGANAVVVNNVPDNCTAVGVPARVIRND
jgi:serine O-acetyltransferase